ncbi:MAG: hypothetical protein EB084_15730 [Proteobacteria bacterium]|nr:hypothetical protein [Pseudomonadota bacterium]
MAPSLTPQRHPASPRWISAIASRRLDTRTLTAEEAVALREHGLAGEAAACVDATSAGPTRAEQVLLDARRADALASLAVAATARKAAALLTEARLPFLVLKGPGLAALTTGTWQGRGGVDIDLLIAPSRVAEAHTLLIDARLRRYDGRTASPGALYRWAFPEMAYVGWPVEVDLHWGLDHSPGMCRLPFEALLERAHPFDLDGVPLRTLGVIDAWLFTAVHGGRSFWNRWKWLLDAWRQWHALSPEQRDATRTAARAAGCAKACADAEALVWWCAQDLDEISPSTPIPSHVALPLARAARLLNRTRVASGVAFTMLQGLQRRTDHMALAPTPLVALDSLTRSIARLVLAAPAYRNPALRG